MKNARQAPQTGLRLPQELKDWLAHRAIDNHRSMNGEIVARLEDSKRREEPTERTAA